MYQVSDIFIGDYPLAERFGQNPDIYSVRYKMQGYPGLRFRCPTHTMVLAAADGFILKTGFIEAGVGRFITIVHDGFLTTYGHLNDITVQKDERVLAGQLIGHSNKSGLTDIECLHFGLAPCDAAGNKTEDNGFAGYIDPLGDRVKWELKALTEPVLKPEVLEEMRLKPKEYTALNAQAANYRVIVSYLKQVGFDDFLKKAGRMPINLDMTPDDSTGGESVNFFLRAANEEYERMQEKLWKYESAESSPTTPDEDTTPKKPNPVLRLFYAIKNFTWESRSTA